MKKYKVNLQSTFSGDIYDTTTGVIGSGDKDRLKREEAVLKTISRLNAMGGVFLSAEEAGAMLERAEREFQKSQG